MTTLTIGFGGGKSRKAYGIANAPRGIAALYARP
jgi:hypothetical protein